MAKTSILAREKRKHLMAARAKNSRNQLRAMIKDAEISYEEKSALVEKLNKKPRNQSPTRISRRCRSCGRPRAVYRKFGICRLCLRNAMMRGDVPGLHKASW